MYTEIALAGVIIVALLYDLIAGGRGRRFFHPVMCTLMVLFIAGTIVPWHSGEMEAFGGMYVYAPVYSIVKALLAAGTLIVFLQSDSWLRRQDTSFKRGEFYVLTLSTLLGMDFMISAGHFMMFFIGMELASVPMACLVAFDKYKDNSAEAGAKYILSALFASGLMLYGISFFYGTAGTLYFSDMAGRIDGSPLQIMAMVFFFSGLGFKISLVPFHLWTADTYQGAPTSVTSYLSVVSKGAGAFAALIILTQVFGAVYSQVWEWMLFILIVLTITVGNLFAIRQNNLKRFLAFSSISQAGYIMLGVVADASVGAAALSYYVLVYIFSNLAAFGVIQAIENATGKVEISDYNGLYKTNPKLSFTMMLAMFSLGGIPPFAGFFSKFFIFSAALEQGTVAMYVLVFIALLNTIVSLYYYLLVVKAMFIIPNDNPIERIKSHWSERAGMVVCVAGIILVGLISAIYTFLNHASDASQMF